MTEQKDSVPNRLLLIDDEPMIVATISDFLRRAGFEVTFTTVASDAIESVRRGRFALTIVDYAMPGLNGLEAAVLFAQLRQPFMFFSAYSDEALVSAAIAAGALAYVVKPIDPIHLVPTIRTAIQRAREIAALVEQVERLTRTIDTNRSDDHGVNRRRAVQTKELPMVAKRICHSFAGLASLACGVAFLLFTLPGLAQQSLQVLHDHLRPAVSGGQAAPVGSLPPTQRLNLSIMLPLRNPTELISLLGRLYDPSSPDYRHFLSVAQFAEQFGPTMEDYRAVVDFAQANGFTVTDTPANRMLVPINGSVAQIEKAFHVSMRIYQHPTENRTFYSPDREPALALSVPVWHIDGLNNFSIPRPMVTKASAAQALANATGSGPGGSYLGSDMRAAYYGGTALTGSGQVVGLWESYSYDINDVNLAFSSAGQSYSVPINNVLLDGVTVGNGEDDAEPVLDIVQAIGMAPGLSQVRVYLGNNQVDIFNAMATENIAKQLSVSYIWEPDNFSTLDPLFEEFVAQGQTLFASSGDNGAYQASAPQYYPAEDVYVTAAGGTSLVTNGAGGSWNSETAWEYSGGGVGPFPYVISIPAWQVGVANSSNGGSTTLRNVPDVAMDSDWNNYSCESGACSGGWGGTSFSAPRWAGFMALVNQQAADQGNPTLGFIDPAIYSIGQSSNYGSDFHDIVSGTNDCCSQTVWYIAVPGYDLVTGWGSPNGQALINALAGGYTLSASPSSLTITQGGSGTTTITVTDEGGFAGSVNLAASGLPKGVTAAFSTNPTTGTDLLTLSASSSATAGTATVTITGTSGSLTATTTFLLTVKLPSLTISVSPNPLRINQCGLATASIMVTGFQGTVTPTLSGLPNGIWASLSPNSTTGSTLLTLIASCSVPTGWYTVTVAAEAGSETASTTLHLMVNPAAKTFTIDASRTSLTVIEGKRRTSRIIVTSVDGFNSAVRLSATGLPSGVTARFSRELVTPKANDRATSVLRFIASPEAPVGTATVTVTGTSGSISESTNITLTVQKKSRHQG